MKFLFRFVLIVVVLGGLGAGGWYLYSQRQTEERTAIVLHGNVDIREIDLAFNATGRITRLNVDEGDRVKKGELLAVLDTRRLESAVKKAEAQVAQQKQVVDELVAGSRPEEIQKGRADLEAAKAVAVNARRSHERIQRLVKTAVATQQQLDDAKAGLDEANAQVEAKRKTLDLLLKGPREEDIAAAKAAVHAFEADVALRKTELADASLFAPEDGVIRNRILEPGDMASPQVPVFTLARTSPIWIRVYVEEPDLGKVHPGMAVTVTTDSYPGKKYAARIGYISPTAEFTPKSVETREVRTSLVYMARVNVENPQNELRLGMPATVTIPLNGGEESRATKGSGGGEGGATAGEGS